MPESYGPNVYRHYKGGLYRVLCECVLSTNGPSDGEIGVVYVSMTNGNVFVRTREEFHEIIPDPINSHDLVKRFKPVG